MQVLKDELRHKILLESEHLFLQRGYDRTSLQMIADKVNISKSNLYHYFKNKEELFYELTDSAADGLKRMILRFRSMRFDLNMDAQEFRMLLTEQPDDGTDHGTQSGGRDGAYPQEPRSPERGPCRIESADYLSHTGNARAAIAALRLSRNYSFADKQERTVDRSKVVRKFLYRNFLPPEVQKG